MGPPELLFQHRILLIEDDNVSLFAASEILSRLTAMVDMARDVEEARDQLDRVAYDLVISDISLPARIRLTDNTLCFQFLYGLSCRIRIPYNSIQITRSFTST